MYRQKYCGCIFSERDRFAPAGMRPGKGAGRASPPGGGTFMTADDREKILYDLTRALLLIREQVRMVSVIDQAAHRLGLPVAVGFVTDSSGRGLVPLPEYRSAVERYVHHPGGLPKGTPPAQPDSRPGPGQPPEPAHGGADHHHPRPAGPGGRGGLERPGIFPGAAALPPPD